MDSTDEVFKQITEAVEFDGASTEARIAQAATDLRLIVAVRDELAASIELLFPFGGEMHEVYEKYHDDARKRVLEVAVNLQHEYGLDENTILDAIVLARSDIEGTGQSFD